MRKDKKRAKLIGVIVLILLLCGSCRWTFFPFLQLVTTGTLSEPAPFDARQGKVIFVDKDDKFVKKNEDIQFVINKMQGKSGFAFVAPGLVDHTWVAIYSSCAKPIDRDGVVLKSTEGAYPALGIFIETSSEVNQNTENNCEEVLFYVQFPKNMEPPNGLHLFIDGVEQDFVYSSS